MSLLSVQKSSLYLFLFELGFGIQLQIIGQISVSELFLLAYIPLYVLPGINWKKEKELLTITKAYVLLLGFQVLSECIVGNILANALKGLAITVVSYFHFVYLTVMLTKQQSLIAVLILAKICNSLIFGTEIEEQSLEDVMQGQAAAYLKFHVAPIAILTCLYMSLLFRNKDFSRQLSLLGIVLVGLGARSSGALAFGAGLLAYVMGHPDLLQHKKKFRTVCILSIAGCYALYAYYVHEVLSGEITSGNSWQLFLCPHPYNPIELLLVGRSEMWVGLQAFMDSFWFGHGAWPYDTDGRYELMLLELHGLSGPNIRLSSDFVIPSHSVWIGSGMMNGIFAFATMGYIVYFFLKRGWTAIMHSEKTYQLVLSYFMLDLFWTAFFSPQSHFRWSMPIAFALLFVMYNVSKKDTADRELNLKPDDNHE